VKITLKCIFKNLDGKAWNRILWLRIKTGSCECSNEPSASIKCGEVLD
jgi:hypothetical protein